MATLVRNKSIESTLTLPVAYGGKDIAPGQGVIIADTVANVQAAFGVTSTAPNPYVEFSTTPDGQVGAITPAATGAGGGLVYTPTTPANWASAPATVGAALDNVAALGGAQGRVLLGVQVITATGTYTPTPGTKRVLVRMVASGGGGGGVANAGAGQCAVGAGGAAGVYFEKYIDPAGAVVGGAATVGAAGVAGVSGGGAGGAGGDASIVINGTTFTAKGGAGGSFTASTATLTMAQGGGATAGSSAGDVSTGQEPGGASQVFSATVASSGFGGSSPWGAGGGHSIAVGAGSPGLGNGGGGSGGVSINASGAAAGGAGSIGKIIVEDFS